MIFCYMLGFMTESEQAIIEKIPSKYNKYWVPLVWSTSLVTRARRENKIKDDFAVKTLVDVFHFMCYSEDNCKLTQQMNVYM